MVFVVERQTTKILPTKPYRIVLGCGLYIATTNIFPRTGQKFTVHENFTPRKIPTIGYFVNTSQGAKHEVMPLTASIVYDLT